MIITDLRTWLGQDNVPIEWPVYGSLPPPPPEGLQVELTPDLFHIEIPDARGVFTLHVGWEDQGYPTGHYLLRLIPRHDVPNTVMRVETTKVASLRFWVLVALRTVSDALRSPDANPA